MDIYEAERVWAEALHSQSLVVQLEYDDELARKALQRIGYLIQRGDHYVVETGHPASLLVGLNLVASAELEQGALWSKIMSAMNNMDNNQGHQTRITKLHRAALNRFGLQRFEHPLGRIGEIILHAGITVHSQRTFIQKLIREYRSVPDFDAAYFCAEVRSIPRERIQSKGLDAPTWHFINQAGDVAEDFVAKCIEVLDDLQDDGILNNGGGQGLPQRVIAEIERVVADLGSLKRLKGSRRIPSPQVRWAQTELIAFLPVLPEHYISQSIWQMDTHLHQSEITVSRTMPGLAPARAQLEIREVTPTLTFTASTLSSPNGNAITRHWNTKLFEEAAPVLIFRPDGTTDNLRGPIEPTVHRILVREHYLGVETRVEIDGVSQDRRVDAPLGWASGDSKSNWVAFEIDLDKAELLEIFIGKNSKAAVKRPVSAFKKPQIFETQEVSGLFDLLGNQILSALPSVSVPVSETGEDIWSYRLTNLEDGSVSELSIKPERGIVRPAFDGALDAHFEVSVSKGFGTGLKFNANVVTDLRNSNPALRLLADDGRGLEPFSTTIERGQHRVEVTLDSRKIDFQLLSSPLSTQSLTVKPQSESLELLNTSSLRNSTWFTPVKAHIEDLPDLQLYASIGEMSGTRLIGVSADKTIVEVRAKETAQRLRFNLAELTETANQKGALALHLVTSTGRRISAGQVYPRKMFESSAFNVETAELELRFRAGAAPEGLEICFYSLRAPWLKPIVKSIESESTAVPKEILGFGEAYFTVAIANPWVESAFPEIPDRTSSNTGKFDAGEVFPEISADHALAYWLNTSIQTPKLFSISIERAWQCMLLGNMQSGAVVNRVAMREFASGILAQNPEGALRSYPSQVRNDEHYLKHLFTTGLISVRAIDSDTGVTNFANKPVLACLLTDSRNVVQVEALLSLATDFWGLKNRIDDEIAVRDGVLAETMISKSSLFAPVPQLFSHYNDDEIETWFADYAPGSLFEGGTMARIARDLAIQSEAAHDVVDRQALGVAVDNLDAAFEERAEAIRRLAGTRPFANASLRDTVRRTRGPRIVTMDLPAVSLRLSLLVRLAARGDLKALNTWTKHMYLHKQISTVSPALAELDLTIAELFLKLEEMENHE